MLWSSNIAVTRITRTILARLRSQPFLVPYSVPGGAKKTHVSWAFLVKSRFPATETAVGRRLGSKRELLRRKPKHLVLAGPFGRQVGEADYSHAMRKASFDRRLDEVGREEGERHRHVDLADAAALSCRDVFRICRGVGDELIEPAAAADNRGDE